MTKMKRTLATALLTAASLMAPAGAFAQTRQQATIPFDFTVGQRLLPAGTYVIKHLGSGMILVQGWKGKELVGAITLITQGNNVRKDADKLVFHKYGDQYFLSEIRGELGETSSKVGTSKLEQRLQREQAAVHNQNRTEIALK
jgi:hypothetical protein